MGGPEECMQNKGEGKDKNAKRKCAKSGRKPQKKAPARPESGVSNSGASKKQTEGREQPNERTSVSVDVDLLKSARPWSKPPPHRLV